MNRMLMHPFDPLLVMRKLKSLRRELLTQGPFVDKRVYVASGSTTQEVADALEVFLLNAGIRPVFMLGDYGLFYEDLAFENDALEKFNPDIVYIHSSFKNLIHIPSVQDSTEDVEAKLSNELDRYYKIWNTIEKRYNCLIIQNNFEPPPYRPLGNLEASHHSGLINFICKLNLKFADAAAERKELFINDLNYLASFHGVRNWFSQTSWYRSKHSVSLECIPYLAHNLSNIILSFCGKSKKALVLDLDNTLWGGVIGDDGLEKIEIGRGSPVAEAYLAFQQFIKELSDRGILLSIASKNELVNALEGLSHPSGVLKESNFVSIKANWLPKADNIQEISQEMNIFPDSLVFVDDNPAERESVRQFLPDVFVLEMSEDISDYIDILDKSGVFEPASVSNDDFIRNSSFKANVGRVALEKKSGNYKDYLRSLEMTAIIKDSEGEHLDRIVQLVNKTNQFNLTTRRYSSGEIEALIRSESHLVIYGSLDDKFGPSGLVSVMLCTITEDVIVIDNWVMSCRVFKRDMEYAMFDELVRIARSRGIRSIEGMFVLSAKNGVVSQLFRSLGFDLISDSNLADDRDRYEIKVHPLSTKNEVIKVKYD